MKKMMPNMETYGGQENPGYKPPSGSAGVKAFGPGSHKKNPLSVPKKGSSIGGDAPYGAADRQKVQMLMKKQEANESQRGKGC